MHQALFACIIVINTFSFISGMDIQNLCSKKEEKIVTPVEWLCHSMLTTPQNTQSHQDTEESRSLVEQVVQNKKTVNNHTKKPIQSHNHEATCSPASQPKTPQNTSPTDPPKPKNLKFWNATPDGKKTRTFTLANKKTIVTTSKTKTKTKIVGRKIYQTALKTDNNNDRPIFFTDINNIRPTTNYTKKYLEAKIRKTQELLMKWKKILEENYPENEKN